MLVFWVHTWLGSADHYWFSGKWIRAWNIAHLPNFISVLWEKKWKVLHSKRHNLWRIACGSCFCFFFQEIVLGDSDVVLAGGAENMSMAPYVVRDIRWGTKFGSDLKVYWLIYLTMKHKVWNTKLLNNENNRMFGRWSSSVMCIL